MRMYICAYACVYCIISVDSLCRQYYNLCTESFLLFTQLLGEQVDIPISKN